MASGKEIRTKIQSIKNTQKITRAMEMVAASKMRRAQDRMTASRPYASKMLNVISHVARSNSEYHHPYLSQRAVNRIGFIVISSDRGLCGGLNSNLFKLVLQRLMHYKKENIPVDLCVIGRKAEAFFKRFGHITASATHLGDTPTIKDLIGVTSVMLESYDKHQIDQLYIFHNVFVNTMTQKPQMELLLPLHAENDEDLKHHWDYIYEPDSKVLLNKLLERYVESQIYQGVVENTACEQAARMVAMKSASENAGELISEFQLIYNKARQAAITQEIAEIVGGAAAV